jgi:hypothetical protein
MRPKHKVIAPVVLASRPSIRVFRNTPYSMCPSHHTRTMEWLGTCHLEDLSVSETGQYVDTTHGGQGVQVRRRYLSGLTACVSRRPPRRGVWTEIPFGTGNREKSPGQGGRLHPANPARASRTKETLSMPLPLHYHTIGQQFRPNKALELSSPCCTLVPRHPCLRHWWQPALPADPDYHATTRWCGGWPVRSCE